MDDNGVPRVRVPSDTTPATKDGISRRTFNRAALASLGTLAVGGVPLIGIAARGGGGGGGGGGGKGGGGGGGTATRNKLRVPVTVKPSDYPLGYSLSAARTSVDLGGGKSSVLAYNGMMPGPTFRAMNGDNVSIAFTNNLTQDSTIHWHGMIVPHEVDGHPEDPVSPGGNFPYNYRIQQRAALNWYHPHPHMLTGEQVCLGLAGAFIINDADELALNLPSGEYEVPLIVRDANFDKSGTMIYNPRTSGFDGKTPLVNGTPDPYLEVKPGVYRFRVLNGANGRVFRLALGNGAPFTVIGNDGGLLESVATESEIEFGPGERLDLLVDFRSYPDKTNIMLRDLNAGWDLLEFRVVSGPVAGTLPTGTLSTITALDSNPATTRYFSFDGMSKINGKLYDMNDPGFTVPFNETERWVFTTNGNAPHPIHVHGASFQVQSRKGGRNRLFSWEGGWKDTVLLLDRETVEILIRFDQFPGLYLMHCHKLEHEDMGMMTNFTVGPVPPTANPFLRK